MLSSNLGWELATLTGFSRCSSVPPGKCLILPRVGHDCVLPYPLEFINCHIIQQYIALILKALNNQ
jgi:hypothetical protein